MGGERIDFRWQIVRGMPLVTEDFLREHGAQEVQTETSGPREETTGRQEPVTLAIVGGILVVKLIGLIRTLAKDGKYDYGLLIDAREKPLKIIERRDWDRGKVVVINAAGETTTIVDARTDPPALEELINSALAGAAPVR